MRPASIAALAFVLASAALALIAAGSYPGSTGVFFFFTACCVAMILAALPRPRLYGYAVLAAFFFMGWWAKAVVHTVWRRDFLEPVGAFAGSGAEWDGALLAMSVAALGVLAVRCAHLAYGAPAIVPSAPPAWFARHRVLIWALTLALLLGVNAANLEFAFYQIGVNPKLLLPLRMHVAAAWLVNIGLALWIAALVWWDHLAGRRTLWAGFLEGLVSSVSAFSRIIYLVHAGGYWLALLDRRGELGYRWKALAVLAGAFFAAFVASLLAVFWLRAAHYPANADLRHNLKSEIPQLLTQRWTGLEGVLAISTTKERSLAQMLRALTESPKVGSDSLYYRAASIRYEKDAGQRFTFGSNAGPLALFLFSGSLGVVFSAMAVLAMVVVVTEEGARAWTGNPFLLAVSGAGLANVVAQTTFFYLTAIFLLQLWLGIAAIGAASRLGRRRP